MYGNGTHKELFIDIETSGTNAEQDAIIQIAGIIRIDGVEQERFSWYMYPSPGDRVSQEALDINNVSRKEAKIVIDGKEYTCVIK